MNTGFPSPAQYYREKNMNLNEYLVPHPESTFFMRVKGSSYEEFEVYKDDVLIIDRSCTPRDYDLVLAIVDGRRSLMRYKRPLMLQGSDTATEIWGTVTCVIHLKRFP